MRKVIKRYRYIFE